MSKPLLMRKRAKLIALIVFLLGLAFLTYLGTWWPGIMIVISIPLALWQYLQGRKYDMWITLFVFGGAFFTVQFDIQWEILLPVLFSLGGIYIFFREWLESKTDKEEEMAEKKEELRDGDKK